MWPTSARESGGEGSGAKVGRRERKREGKGGVTRRTKDEDLLGLRILSGKRLRSNDRGAQRTR
eukprot:6075552-Pyramimonas_sp.AAC.1